MSRDKLILLFGLVTYGMGQSLLFIVGAPLSRAVGLSEFQFGMIVAASNVVLAFSAPWWGRRSQSLGRKPVYLVGLGGFALGYGLLALGFQAGLWGLLAGLPLFMALLGARLAYGVLVGAVQPAATAYIADTTDEQSRAAGMALIAMSGGLGTIIGPVFGGVLATFGPVVPMYAVALLALVALLVTMRELPEPERQVSQGPDAPLWSTAARVVPYLVGWFVIFGVFTAVQLVATFYIQDRYGVTGETRVIQTASMAFLSMAIGALIVQAGVLQLWKGAPGLLLRLGFLLFTGGMLLLAFGPVLIFLHLGFFAMGLAFGFIAPGLNAAASLSVPREDQGAVAGLLAMAPTVGMIFGPALGGLIYAISPNLTMTGGAVLSLAMVIWFLFISVPDPRQDAQRGSGPAQ
ncbi:MAG: MFS transporter [Chromatiales bacterium]|nr:MFS transporter [Chromatiales bacterium]